MKINPIKWSTKKLKALIEKIESTGTMPRNNPFHDGDLSYKSEGVKWVYTEEEAEELIRIKTDIFYFAENVAKVMTDKKGITTLKEVGGLRDYQKSTLLDLVRYRFNIWLASRQIGKCVCPYTKITIKDNKGNLSIIPIFELYYTNVANIGIIDKLKLNLYRISYRLRNL